MNATDTRPIVREAEVLGGTDTPRARRRDLITSHEAADTNDVTRSLGLVLHILNTALEPITDEEIETRAVVGHGSQFTGQRLRTARRHLVRMALVERAEQVGRTSHGRRSAKWQVTQ